MKSSQYLTGVATLTGFAFIAALAVGSLTPASNAIENAETDKVVPIVDEVAVVPQSFTTLTLGGANANQRGVTKRSPAVSAEELRDLEFIADYYDEPLEVVSARNKEASEFSEFATWLSDNHAEAYTTAVYSAEWLDRPRVTLTQIPTDAVIQRAEEMSFEIDLRFGANANEDELMELSAGAIDAVIKQIGPHAAPMSRINEDNLSIEVYYGTGDYGRNLSTQASLAAIAKSYTGDQLMLPVPIEFNYDESIGGGILDANVRGGYGLTNAGGVKNLCTSGFSVNRSGTKGVVTAGHCTNALYYQGINSVISYVLEYPTYKPNQPNRSLDVQFHKTLGSHVTQGKFRADSGDIRDVTASPIPTIGSYVCKYGMRTQKTCSTIIDTAQCRYFSTVGLTYCRLAVTREAITLGGDSGGPFYLGTKAIGTVTGRNFQPGSEVLRTMFTSIKAVKTELGANVIGG